MTSTTTTIVNKGIETVTSALTTVVNKVESYDEEAKKRTKVYCQSPNEKSVNSHATEYQNLKVVTGDLIDLWMYEGHKGLQYI